MALSSREIAKRYLEAHWQETSSVVSLTVFGASMGSALPAGSAVDVLFERNMRLEKGSLVYIRRGTLRVVHRLLLVMGLVCVEKGDANRYPRLCLRSSILGKVVGLPRTPKKAEPEC